MMMTTDPWSSLVQSLAGRRRKPPESWPERKVHRMLDDLPAELLRREGRRNPPPRTSEPR